MTEEEAGLDDELSNDSCFNKQTKAAKDSVTIDTIINLVRLQFYLIERLQCYLQQLMCMCLI